MLNRFNTTIKSTMILSLILGVTIIATGAVNHYSASAEVPYGGGVNYSDFRVVDDADRKVRIRIPSGKLDSYMDEQGLNEVTITADVTEELVSCGNGIHYHLDFTFGPSGAHFDPKDLCVKLTGDYVSTGCHVWLYNEDGEALEGTRDDKADKIIFKVPHFSSYSYDHYDD